MWTNHEACIFAMGGDFELLPEGGELGEEFVEEVGVGRPEGDNVGLAGLKVKVGGQRNFLEYE